MNKVDIFDPIWISWCPWVSGLHVDTGDGGDTGLLPCKCPDLSACLPVCLIRSSHSSSFSFITKANHHLRIKDLLLASSPDGAALHLLTTQISVDQPLNRRRLCPPAISTLTLTERQIRSLLLLIPSNQISCNPFKVRVDDRWHSWPHLWWQIGIK